MLTFDIKCTRQSDAVSTPSTTMGEEVIRLGRTRGLIRVGEVVPTTDQACASSAVVVLCAIVNMSRMSTQLGFLTAEKSGSS
jgi:hypothetical protein